MYQYLVVSTQGYWNSGAFSYQRDRFCENQNGPAFDRFRTLTPGVIAELLTYPALFAYEGKDGDVRVGRLTRIHANGGMVSGTFELEPSIPPIPYGGIDLLAGKLDLGTTNNSRTKWVIKDADLLSVLVKAKLVSETCHSCQQVLPWSRPPVSSSDVWTLLHPKVLEVAKPRFDAGLYADAVEASFKVLSGLVKDLYKEKTGEQRDGVDLMRKTFTPSSPVIVFDDLGTQSGRDIQQGYMDIFSGAMSAIRNPKAHGLVIISPERAVHHLMLASLLFSKLDERQA